MERFNDEDCNPLLPEEDIEVASLDDRSVGGRHHRGDNLGCWGAVLDSLHRFGSRSTHYHGEGERANDDVPEAVHRHFVSKRKGQLFGRRRRSKRNEPW